MIRRDHDEPMTRETLSEREGRRPQLEAVTKNHERAAPRLQPAHLHRTRPAGEGIGADASSDSRFP